MTLEGRSRWLALYVLCLGTLMIVLDATIVNVALPSIKADLGFSDTSLAWVVNAYLLTYGGLLLVLFPYTRLVHIVTYPVSYLWRPYQRVIWNRRRPAIHEGARR